MSLVSHNPKRMSTLDVWCLNNFAEKYLTAHRRCAKLFDKEQVCKIGFVCELTAAQRLTSAARPSDCSLIVAGTSGAALLSAQIWSYDGDNRKRHHETWTVQPIPERPRRGIVGGTSLGRLRF